MKKYIIIFMLLSLTLFGCCKLTKPDTNKKTWTFMWYLDGDEVSMQQDFIAAFYNIIASGVGSTDDVNIIIQFDRFPHMDDFGGWEIAERFYYTSGMEPTPANSIQDWGDGQGGREVDMADPATLQSFIIWAAANYPAEHYALMLADHGYGWQGMLIDETSNGDFMTLKGAVSALKNSGVHFDLLALNACTMQMIEVMHELLEVPIDIVVGSENLGTTWAFTEILQVITDDPAITAANLGKEICDFYYDIHPTDTLLTLSTIQLNKIPAVEDALADFCNTILDSVAFEVIQPKAQVIMDAIDAAVLHKVSGYIWDDAGGLSIYWPPMDQGYMPHVFFYSYIDEIISFPVDNPWRQYLYVFYNLWTYPGIIPGEIYQVYNQLSFFDDDKIDLYDFCKGIVDYQAP
jgi:hypothetical protein